ncbi:MAG: phosphopyruvate hydratase [Candidatus Micrarchaeia archaeon]
MRIEYIHAREILDSRGNPTIEVDVSLKAQNSKSGVGRASAPSGASTGMLEAVELRDNEKRYLGKGVLNAVKNVNEKIAPKLEKREFDSAKEYDDEMIELDGTVNKSKLGANAIVSVSMAIRKAVAIAEGKKLYEVLSEESSSKPSFPTPMLNIINGGKHAGGTLSIQEFMIIPKLKDFRKNLQISSEIYHILGEMLAKRYGVSSKNVGDEGGYAPKINTTNEAFDAIIGAIEEAGYLKEVALGIDAAASSFYKNGEYKIKIGNKTGVDAKELLEFYVELAGKYPLISIEDPFYEKDFESFSELTKKIGNKIQIVGDDLLVTNPKIIQMGIEKKSCNALLLKVNQIGSVSEGIIASKMCKKAGWKTVVSHRSGETEDSFIADLAVGIGAEYIKTGAPARGERTAKYNQLLRIEEGLNI